MKTNQKQPYKWLITTSRGIAPTLKRELKYLRYKPFGQFETGVYIEAPLEACAHLNIRLRTASKARLILKEKDSINTFEDLFQTVKNIDRTPFIGANTPIVVSAISHKSDLSSERTIQSIAHKAVITSLTGSPEKKWKQDASISPAHIRISISHNTIQVAINTSGPALHQRGRRQSTGDAPLKEHIAAALVLMTSRGYSSPLIDPYCGSGTILIEAAMIATNRAPGLLRTFACEQFPCLTNTTIFTEEKEKAQQKIFAKQYDIMGYDIDESVLSVAQSNAKRAGVAEHIIFGQGDSTLHSYDQEDTIITNPPYGKRIGQDTVHHIHECLFNQAKTVKNITIITGYEQGGDFVDASPLQRKENICLNGADECGILMRKENI